MLEPLDNVEIVQWQAYPSWGQFIWLYFMSGLTALRGLLLLTFEMPGWSLWLCGAGALLACAAFLRRWARYRITSSRVLVENGYTGREIEAVPIGQIAEIALWQGPMAEVMRIGTLVIRTTGDGQIRLRGIKDPEVVRLRLQAMRPAGDAAAGERTSP